MFLQSQPRYRSAVREYVLTARMPLGVLSRTRQDPGIRPEPYAIFFRPGSFDDAVGSVDVRLNHREFIGRGQLIATRNEVQLQLRLDPSDPRHARLIDNAAGLVGISVGVRTELASVEHMPGQDPETVRIVSRVTDLDEVSVIAAPECATCFSSVSVSKEGL